MGLLRAVGRADPPLPAEPPRLQQLSPLSQISFPKGHLSAAQALPTASGGAQHHQTPKSSSETFLGVELHPTARADSNKSPSRGVRQTMQSSSLIRAKRVLTNQPKKRKSVLYYKKKICLQTAGRPLPIL